MDPETKKLMEDLSKAHAEFMKTNDDNLKKNSAELEVKLKTLNETMDTIQSKLDKLTKAKARGGLSPEMEEKAETANLALKNFFMKGGDNLTDAEIKAFSIGDSSEGGYLLNPDIRDIVNARIFETSDIRAVANVIQTDANEVDMPILTNKIDSGWVSERGSRAETATNKSVGMIKIPCHESYTEPFATQRFLDTVKNSDQTVLDLIAQSLMLVENTAFASGNGVGKPLGFLTNTVDSTEATPASYSSKNVEAVKSGSSAVFTADNLISLVTRLKSEYKKNAKFMINRETVGYIRKLKDTYGQYLWTPSLAAGNPNLLLGYPVIEANDIPVIAASSLSVAFGDFKKAYTIVDGKKMTILRDPYSNKPYIAFYTTKDVGGGVVVAEALKLLKLAA